MKGILKALKVIENRRSAIQNPFQAELDSEHSDHNSESKCRVFRGTRSDSKQ